MYVYMYYFKLLYQLVFSCIRPLPDILLTPDGEAAVAKAWLVGESLFLFCLLPSVPGDHSIPHLCIHLLLSLYKLY